MEVIALRKSDIAGVGALMSLAVLELFHPQPHDLLKLDLPMWFGVHYAQIPLFPLAALALAGLIRGRSGIAPAVARVMFFLFAATWTAWDAVAGVATGILVNAAQKSGTPEAWLDSVNAIWLNPVIGGAPAPLFAVLGSIALSVGVIAAGIVLKRAGHSWPPVLLLIVASFGVAVFKTHAWPGGPVTFGGLALASGWLLKERSASGSLGAGAAGRGAHTA